MTSAIKSIVDDIGGCILFLKDVLRLAIFKPGRPAVLADQIWRVSTQSMSTTALAGFFAFGFCIRVAEELTARSSIVVGHAFFHVHGFAFLRGSCL